MKLNSFLNEKKRIKRSINKEDYSIILENNIITFNFKSLKSLDRFRNFLFFAPSKSIITNSILEIENFFNFAIESNVEGIMIKNLEETYKSGLRVGAMTKLKFVKDTLDLVILAGEYGKGKRGGLLSSFIIGVIDNLTDQFLEIGKVSSGLNEGEDSAISIKNLNEILKKYKIGEKGNVVYFEPKVVIEVAYQDIMKSNKYSSGYSLRFPRIVSLREDKNLEEITSLSYIQNNL